MRPDDVVKTPLATEDEPLLVVLGPTASGKESTASWVAPHLNAELVVCDSVKPYRGLGIASAAPPPGHEAAVPHHLVGVVEPWEPLNAARWLELAERAIRRLRERGKRVVIAGGTALYLKSMLFGIFEGPAADRELRARLEREEERAPGSLHKRVRAIDPVTAGRVHAHDTKRLVRAIEVFEKTGRPISAQQAEWDAGPRLPYVAVGLRRERSDLVSRIDGRVERMVEAGLLDEIRALLEPGVLGPTAAEAIGVKELVPLLREEAASGVLDRDALEQALERVRIHTRQLSRHQTKWWRRFPGVHWIDVEPDDPREHIGARALEIFRAHLPNA